LSPPLTSTLGVCQTYKCNSTNACVPQNKTDGTDCTSPTAIGTKLPSVCISGKCKQLVLGLTDLAPFRNIGCVGLDNAVACDTNDVLGDGEVCMDGLCKFPDGTNCNSYTSLALVKILNRIVIVIIILIDCNFNCNFVELKVKLNEECN
jgi:hypothetical protein